MAASFALLALTVEARAGRNRDGVRCAGSNRRSSGPYAGSPFGARPVIALTRTRFVVPSGSRVSTSFSVSS
jgi:hypothetical protein